MDNKEIIYKFLKDRKIQLCDDCLSEELDINPRQQVNQLCRKLHSEGLIDRASGQCDFCRKDKLVNCRDTI